MSEQAQRGGHSKLADVKPGGRVRLADQALSTTELRRNAHVLVLQELRARFTDAGSPSRTAALDAAIAAISAQPSPGGQGDAVHCGKCKDRGYLDVDVDVDDSGGSIGNIEACPHCALAARQPVGEPVDDDAASEAFGEFADDYLTDGDGYAPASTYEACSKAFNAAWPDRVAATAAARAELKRLHGDDRTVGARRAEALNRAAAHGDAEDDAAPPAQAVDLGRVRALVQSLLNWIDDWAETPEESGIDAIEAEAEAVLALIDSHSEGGQP